MLIDFQNKIFLGSNSRKSVFDCQIPENPQAVVIFVHGYSGYKDWGAWNLMQDFFVDRGFGFVKFNLSHNGGTVDAPIDFNDLEAYSLNRFTYEIFDIQVIIEEIYRMAHQELELAIPIYLLGHSRGGGMSVLAGGNDERVNGIVSLAGISETKRRFPTGELLEAWEKEGVRYVLNTRTHQNMPHYYSFYTDFLENEEELNIESAARKLTVPFLQIHGDMDESISISEGQNMAIWTNTQVKIVKGAGHTFGAVQPWTENQLPDDLKRAAEFALEFFSNLNEK
jgi:pimeloyl-ACP methyl ester carboxylesterase